MPQETTKLPHRAPIKIVEKQLVSPENIHFGHHPQTELFPLKEEDINGIEMGILSDSTPYLTLRGLSKLAGVDHAMLGRFTNNWDVERLSNRGRGKFICQTLLSQGYDTPALFVKVKGKYGETHAYPDFVCMAILEYYAFEASQNESSEIAVKNYRMLARESLRAFIYKACNYYPVDSKVVSWQNFHDRLLLNEQLPQGYFSIFKEITDIIVRMIREGCQIDSHTLPDASVGITWGHFWQEIDGDLKFGERIKFPHIFPEDFPQAAAGPIEAWIYPNSALGEFRNWLEVNYLPQKFPQYIARKIKSGLLIEGQAKQLLSAVLRR